VQKNHDSHPGVGEIASGQAGSGRREAISWAKLYRCSAPATSAKSWNSTRLASLHQGSSSSRSAFCFCPDYESLVLRRLHVEGISGLRCVVVREISQDGPDFVGETEGDGEIFGEAC
jgi:hypothetical protein